MEGRILDQAGFYKCVSCSCEFLSKINDPVCPRCKGRTLERKDIKGLGSLDE